MRSTNILLATLTLISFSLAKSVADPAPLLLKDARQLLTTKYPPEEKGWVQTSDGMYYIASEFHTKIIAAYN